MLGKTVMINVPSYFRAIFRAVSIFMPKSALEKVGRPFAASFDPPPTRPSLRPHARPVRADARQVGARIPPLRHPRGRARPGQRRPAGPAATEHGRQR